MEAEDEERNRLIGAHGAELLPDEAKVLTHCNAGSLATAYFGTALGVIFTAHEQGKIAHVWVDETRPVNQGGRLTAWELGLAGVPSALIADSMAGFVMSKGWVDAVIVGADRIAANGDTANKIGTYGLAVLAKQHGIPFYVAAPTSTVDLTHRHRRGDRHRGARPARGDGLHGLGHLRARLARGDAAFDVLTEDGAVRHAARPRATRWCSSARAAATASTAWFRIAPPRRRRSTTRRST